MFPDVSIFIITSDGQYIPSEEYRSKYDADGVFVMLTNDNLNQEFGDDNSICIYRNWMDIIAKPPKTTDDNNHAGFPWQFEARPIPGMTKLNESTDELGDYGSPARTACMLRYLNGYETTHGIMRNTARISCECALDEYIPAVMVAYRAEITFGGHTIHGYLPAIGQLTYVAHNIEGIRSSLMLMEPHAVKAPSMEKAFQESGIGFWSSTEYNNGCAWYSYFPRKAEGYTGKSAELLILPLYTL